MLVSRSTEEVESTACTPGTQAILSLAIAQTMATSPCRRRGNPGGSYSDWQNCMCRYFPGWRSSEGSESHVMVKNCCLLLQNIAVDALASCENVLYSDTKTKGPLCPVDVSLPPSTLNGSSTHLSPRELTAFVHVFQRQAWTETPCVWCRPSLCFESLLCSRMQTASLPGEGRDFFQAYL